MNLLRAAFRTWNLLCTEFCSGSLLHIDLFTSWKLLIDYFFRETYFVHGTCCMLIFVLEIVHCFFSSWNWFFQRTWWVLTFVHRTCCVLIFVRWICCPLIFLLEKLVHWFISLWNWFGQGTFCLLIFVRGMCSMLIFLLVKLLHFETVTLWNVKLICSRNLPRADFC